MVGALGLRRERAHVLGRRRHPQQGGPAGAAHPPAALVTHGAKGKDTFGNVIDFADASAAWVAEIKAEGGFAIECDDGSTHTDFATRTKVAPQALQFFLDHPYGVKPEPYTALPAGWPSYCTIK